MMKYFTYIVVLFLLFFGLFLSYIQAQSLSLEIKKKDNTEQKVPLIEIKKLSFSGSDLVINHTSGSAETISLSDIKKIIFGTISGLNNSISSTSPISLFPNPATNFIGFKNAEQNTLINILNINGIEVIKYYLPSSTTIIDISHLQKGIYIVKIGNQAFKFIKL